MQILSEFERFLMQKGVANGVIVYSIENGSFRKIYGEEVNTYEELKDLYSDLYNQQTTIKQSVSDSIVDVVPSIVRERDIHATSRYASLFCSICKVNDCIMMFIVTSNFLESFKSTQINKRILAVISKCIKPKLENIAKGEIL